MFHCRISHEKGGERFDGTIGIREETIFEAEEREDFQERRRS